MFRFSRSVDDSPQPAHAGAPKNPPRTRRFAMKKPGAYRILAATLLALSHTAGPAAEAEQRRDGEQRETRQAEAERTASLPAERTGPQQRTRDSLNELERRLIAVERQTINIENSLRMVGFDTKVLERRVRRLETRIESMEMQLTRVERKLEGMNNNIIHLAGLIAQLVELRTTGSTEPQ